MFFFFCYMSVLYCTWERLLIHWIFFLRLCLKSIFGRSIQFVVQLKLNLVIFEKRLSFVAIVSCKIKKLPW